MSSDDKESIAPFLFEKFDHPSGLALRNRIVLSPLTRGRSGHSRVPNDLNLKYYTDRAAAGLIITEAASFSDTAHGWAQSAAIQTDEQMRAWKAIVDEVHRRGSLICCQLWHTGRASHSSFQVDRALPIAPSAIQIEGDGVYDINTEKQPHETPRAIRSDEIPGLVQSYADAARRCQEAGFDFIQIHAANGYLIDQFLQSCSNQRTDGYGGSVENRYRFLKEVVEACGQVYPYNKIMVRISPNGAFNGMGSDDNIEQFTYVASQLNAYGLGCLECMDGTGFGFHQKTRRMTLADLRKVFDGPIMGNVGYTRDTADGAIRSGAADLISFGRPFIANPDLVERFRNDWPLAEGDPATWFSHDAEGYTDYPTYEEAQAPHDAEGITDYPTYGKVQACKFIRMNGWMLNHCACASVALTCHI